MIVQTEKEDFNDLADRIIEGVNKELRQLVETSAANDKSLVVGDENGGFKTVPAKELLKTFSK